MVCEEKGKEQIQKILVAEVIMGEQECKEIKPLLHTTSIYDLSHI